ncbi:N-ATPase, AtpR subunit [uncultured archaeon]|nr:N-ATPase, AtpR subunit [uncultured archaeon]
MNEILVLALAIISGIVLGVFYFGGLWLTLQHLSRSRQPAFLVLSSFLVRSAVCLFCFYLVASNSWEGLVSSLAGFTFMKLALTHRLGRYNYKELD